MHAEHQASRPPPAHRPWIHSAAVGLGVLILLSTATSAWSAVVAGDTLTAEVLFVLDGDSLRARIAATPTAPSEERELRLWGIDAPERDQPGADTSRQALKTLVHGKTTTIHVITVDQFDRLVVHMQVGNIDVNLRQLEHGHAWWFRRFAARATAYQAAEAKARSGHLGVWADEQPEAPWVYRDRIAPVDATNK